MKFASLILTTIGLFNSALAAETLNGNFECSASKFYGSLQVKVIQTPNSYRIRMQSYHATQAAAELGLDKSDEIDSIEVDFPIDRCSSSKKNLGVVSCRIYPNRPLDIKGFDRNGIEVSTGKLGVFDFQMEKTTRIASSYEGDFKRQYIELSAFFISETDNGKRAELNLRYEPSDCISR